MAFDLGDIFGSGTPASNITSNLGITGSGGKLSQLSDKLFGDVTGEGQAEVQRLENLAKQEFIKQQAEQARGDIFKLFPAAEQARQLGTQGALDIFGQTIPQQMDVFQQGNVGAQQALTQGLPQILAALRGTPIDLSQLQPQTLSFDPSFAQQQLPQFQSTASLFPQQPNINPKNPQTINGLLTGGTR